MHPFFDINLNRILQGNALELLKTFPSDSIDCVITSPPYWALRDYQLEPQIWDGDEKCEHQWGEDIAGAGKNNDQTAGIIQRGNKGSTNRDNRPSSNFCSRCGAWKGSLGLEPSFTLFISHLIQIFTEVKRVLKPTGTCWINLGDSYAGSNGNGYKQTLESEKTFLGKTNNNGLKKELSAKEKHHAQARYEPRARTNEVQAKSLCQIPSRFAIAMTDNGWLLRNSIIWEKPNSMPSSVKDRFSVNWEYIFFFTKSPKYFFEQQFEPYQTSSVLRLDRGINENNKWADGPDGQTAHTISKPRLNKNKMPGIGGIKHQQNGNPTYSGNKPLWTELGRNKRAVWSISTGGGTSSEHFASYPPQLIETPVRAGCPEFVCNKCGKPREKIYEDTGERVITENMKIAGCNKEGKYFGSETKEYESANAQKPSETKRRILESMSKVVTMKLSDCGCGKGFSAGIVLDCFAGTGTTAVVARKLNRNFIGIDLNQKYCHIAEKRIRNELGLFV